MTTCTCITPSDGTPVIRDPWCPHSNHGDPAFVNPGPDVDLPNAIQPPEPWPDPADAIPTHIEQPWPGTERSEYFKPLTKPPEEFMTTAPCGCRVMQGWRCQFHGDP